MHFFFSITQQLTFFRVLFFWEDVSGSSVKKMCVFLLFLGLRMSKNLDLSFAFFSKYCTLRWVKSGIPPYLKKEKDLVGVFPIQSAFLVL